MTLVVRAAAVTDVEDAGTYCSRLSVWDETPSGEFAPDAERLTNASRRDGKWFCLALLRYGLKCPATVTG